MYHISIFRSFPPNLAPSFGVPLACRWNSTVSTSSIHKSKFLNQTKSNTPASKPPIRTRLQSRQRFFEDQKAQGESKILERFQIREWKAGDIYAPHDLSPAEMRKWMKRQSPPADAFDALNMNPLDQYKNFSIMSEYITPMGRIKHRVQTGLRPVNQRKIAKAIRRAIGLGLMPSVHKHPEILAADAIARLDAGRVAWRNLRRTRV